MILFLIKGLLRDRSRSLFPLMTVAIGVMLTVLLESWVGGIMGDVIRSNANFSTGHVRVMTRAYAENEHQLPNDLALLDAEELLYELESRYPHMTWVRRIRFGGLLDVPDEAGETRSQGTAAGLAVDLLSSGSSEPGRLNVADAMVRGRMPAERGEILLGEEFARKLEVEMGGRVTLLSSTMYGGMVMWNFVVVGTVRFGIGPMDRGAMLADVSDMGLALDMEDAAGEVLGYFGDGVYHDGRALELARAFNGDFPSGGEFDPVMFALREQNDLGEYLDLIAYFSGVLTFIFVLAMSIVLWNAGLIGGLRRYGEVGLRLAIGEDKGHVYRSVIVESLAIGTVGSLIGTALGMLVAWYGQTRGFDFGAVLKHSSMMLPNVLRTRITLRTCYIGFIPGLLSTFLGAALSGVGIYRRQTARLFRELES